MKNEVMPNNYSFYLVIAFLIKTQSKIPTAIKRVLSDNPNLN